MATRFYLPSSGAAAVSPSYDAGWESTSIAARLKCVTTKVGSTMTTVSYDDANNTLQDILYRQYVSDPIQAQTIAAQTLTLQVRCSETNIANNLYVKWDIKVVSGDGATVRGTALAMRRDATEAATSLTNRRDTFTSTEVTALEGDRIVIEIGMSGDPAAAGSHDSSISIGDDSATDLPGNDTETAAYNPWVQFANDIAFYSEPIEGAAAITLAGCTLSARAVVGTIETFTDGYGGDVFMAQDNVLNGTGAPYTTYNLGAHANYETSNDQNGLFRFDLSSIPSGSVCAWAKLHLYKSYPMGEGSSYPVTLDVYSVASANSAWVEGTKSLALAGSGESCWNALAADGAGGITTAWAGGANGCGVSGTDYEATLLGTLTYTPIDDAIGTEYIIDIDPDRIEGWFGSTNTNYGLLTKNSNAGSDHVGLSDNSTTAYRPKLVVYYVEPSGITGSAAITLGAVTASGAGTVAISGAANITLGAVTSSAAGVVTVVGSASITLGAATLVAAGTVATVDAITGAASITLGGLTASGAGVVTVTGAGAVTLSAVTSSGAGAVAIVGAAAITLGAVTSSAAGKVAIVGAASITLGAATLSATGTVASAGAITGAAAITLGGLASTGAGVVTVAGAASITLGALTAAGAGKVAITGAASVTLSAVTSSGAGVVTIAGQASIALGAVTSAGAGAVTIIGAASIALGALTLAAVGTVTIPTPTPAERIYIVALDDRVIVIPAQLRVYVVPEDDRGETVAADNRAYVIAAESRVVEVQ